MGYNTKNLYDQLDRDGREKVQTESVYWNRRRRRKRFISIVMEYGRALLFIAAIIGVFAWKHDGHFIQDTLDYFENFGNPNYVNRGKEPIHPKTDVLVENKSEQALVPMINIQGQLTRNGEKFIIFQYNNIVYTVKTGERFGDKYYVSNVDDKELEVVDTEGNYFYYEVPDRSRVKQ